MYFSHGDHSPQIMVEQKFHWLTNVKECLEYRELLIVVAWDDESHPCILSYTSGHTFMFSSQFLFQIDFPPCSKVPHVSFSPIELDLASYHLFTFEQQNSHSLITRIFLRIMIHRSDVKIARRITNSVISTTTNIPPAKTEERGDIKSDNKEEWTKLMLTVVHNMSSVFSLKG